MTNTKKVKAYAVIKNRGHKIFVEEFGSVPVKIYAVYPDKETAGMFCNGCQEVVECEIKYNLK